MAGRSQTSSRNSATGGAKDVSIAQSLTTRPSYRQLPQKTRTQLDTFDEIGTSGLRQFGGFVLEEWLAQLTGRREAWAYREMIDNDPVVGGILFAINMLARKVTWWAEGYEGQDDERTEFIYSCMNDMSHTWVDFLCEALSMIPYGWAFHEVVYKRRDGLKRDRWETDPSAESGVPETEEDSSPASSQYKDGKIGWRKIPVRAQETLLRWHFDGYSGIRAMEQVDWHGGDHVIPIQKALLFRTQTTRNNPQGRSILRNSWIPYYSLKNIQALEAIGIERDLAGIPVATPPEGIDLFAASQATLLQEVRAMVTSIRRDEYEGIVLPTADWKLELLHSGGQRQIDTDKIIRRYEQRIASSVLADFILIGQDAIGSYAMVDVKSDLFGIAIDTILDLICEPINRYGIPRLLALNGMDTENPPQVRHSSAGRLDFEKVGAFFRDISMAGAPIPWSKELIASLFGELGLPAAFEGPLETQEYPTGDVHRVGEGAKPEPAKPPPPKTPEAVAMTKAEQTQTPGGTVIHVGPALSQRADVLSTQLEREIVVALGHLGDEAAHAYMAIAEKARVKVAARFIAKIMRSLNLQQWIDQRLMPLLENHAGRVTGDTQRILSTEVDQEVHIADQDAVAIASKAGEGLSIKDLEPQVRAAITRAIEQGFAAKEGPVKTAARIGDAVPAGRFVHAGAKYRSLLISRDQTANLQRAATAAAYKSMPTVTAVQLDDGIYGPPRSDQQCIDRAGKVVPIDQIDKVAPYHTQCTLGFLPIVGPQPLPEAA